MSTIWEDLVKVKDDLTKLRARAEDRPVTTIRVEQVDKWVDELADILERFGDPDQLFEPKPDYIDASGKKTVSLADLGRDELELTLLTGSSMDELTQQAERWASEYPKQLGFATDTWRKASYLLYHHLGFKPSGKAKTWLGVVAKLMEMAGSDLGILEQGVIAAAKARQSDGITLPSVMSVQSFVRSAAGEQEVIGRPTLAPAGETKRVSL